MADWLQNPLVVIGIAIGTMFFGYFFGLFEGRGQGYKKRQKEEAEDKKLTQPVEPLPPASPPAPSDDIPMLNVSMAPNGELRLKLDGQPTDTSTLNAEHRKRLVAILTQIRPWLEAPKPASPPKAVQSPQGAPPQPVASPKEVSSPQKTPVPAPAPAADDRPTAPPPPKDNDEPVPAPQSIVAQIDLVLQARLSGTPLAGKGIRLQESPEGGVIVWVGVAKYGAIDEVPDEQIKAALRAAIAEWENKYTPGR